MATKKKAAKARKRSTNFSDGRRTGKSMFFGKKERVPKKIQEIDDFLKTANGITYKKLITTAIERYEPNPKVVREPDDKTPDEAGQFLQLVAKSKFGKGNRKCVAFLKKENTPNFRFLLFSKYGLGNRIYNNWKANKYNIAKTDKYSATDKMLLALFKVWFAEASTLEANDKNIECYLRCKFGNLWFSSIFAPLAAVVMGLGIFYAMKQAGLFKKSDAETTNTESSPTSSAKKK